MWHAKRPLATLNPENQQEIELTDQERIVRLEERVFDLEQFINNFKSDLRRNGTHLPHPQISKK
jgi:hypothetical protein